MQAPVFSQNNPIFPDFYIQEQKFLWDPVRNEKISLRDSNLKLPAQVDLERSSAGRLCRDILKDLKHPDYDNLDRLIGLYANTDYDRSNPNSPSSEALLHNLQVYYDRGMIVRTIRDLMHQQPDVANHLINKALAGQGLEAECALLGLAPRYLQPSTLTQEQVIKLSRLLDGRELTRSSYFYAALLVSSDSCDSRILPGLVKGLEHQHLYQAEDRLVKKRWDYGDGTDYCQLLISACIMNDAKGVNALVDGLNSNSANIKNASAVSIFLVNTNQGKDAQTEGFLDQLAPRAVALLCELLSEDSPHSKRAALNGLSGLARRAQAGLSNVLALTNDKDQTVRSLAIASIGFIAGPHEKVIEKYTSLLPLFLEIQPTEQLSDQGIREEDSEDQMAIASNEIRPETIALLDGLASILDDERARALYKQALDHKESIVVDYAVQSLSGAPNFESAKELIKHLWSPERILSSDVFDSERTSSSLQDSFYTIAQIFGVEARTFFDSYIAELRAKLSQTNNDASREILRELISSASRATVMLDID
jgi:HEAT repeat protein